MGNRLSKIYTRTGDDGTTGLGDGSRTLKDSPRVEAMGDVDELNAAIGVLLTEPMPDNLTATLIAVQHDLFNLGGEICIPGHIMIDAKRIQWLEETLDGLNAPLPPLKEFILPGGSRAAAYCHQARTICRRAERRVITLKHTEAINDSALQYLNRLSDLLFVMARTFNRIAHQQDVFWQH